MLVDQEYRSLERPSAGFAPIPHTMPSGPPSPTSTAQTLYSESGSPPKQPPYMNAASGPPVTNPRPSFAQSRNRSPSGSSSLSDLAHQGKKALKGLLQDGNRGGPVLNTMREGLGVDGRNQAMKGVKAKREADEADKEYRKGVHWLETLRLRRANTIRSGYTVRHMSPASAFWSLTRLLVCRAWKTSFGKKAPLSSKSSRNTLTV